MMVRGRARHLRSPESQNLRRKARYDPDKFVVSIAPTDVVVAAPSFS